MPSDFPDFSIPIWSKRDVAGKEATMKSWAFESATDIQPGDYATYNVYTVPSGVVFFSSDIGMGLDFRGWALYRISGGADIWSAVMEPWDMKMISLSTPFVMVAGETLQAWAKNEDIVPGKFHGYYFGWEEPGSKPAKPKKDDPEERYILGDFNRANLYFLPDGETLILFNKIKEGKMNYLKYKNFGFKNQKKLASFHLKLNEAKNILDITHTNPKKVKEVLRKYEAHKTKT